MKFFICHILHISRQIKSVTFYILPYTFKVYHFSYFLTHYKSRVYFTFFFNTFEPYRFTCLTPYYKCLTYHTLNHSRNDTLYVLLNPLELISTFLHATLR